MATTRYTDIGTNQQDGLNFPGGGLTTQPGTFNDPILEGSTLNLITATYTMTGTEVANDLIYIARIPAGTLISPESNVAGNGVAATATLTVGDTDTQGATVSADLSRYSGSIDVHSAMTAPLAFASGTVLTAPASTTDEGVWVVGKFATLATPAAGYKLVFRLRATNNR